MEIARAPTACQSMNSILLEKLSGFLLRLLRVHQNDPTATNDDIDGKSLCYYSTRASQKTPNSKIFIDQLSSSDLSPAQSNPDRGICLRSSYFAMCPQSRQPHPEWHSFRVWTFSARVHLYGVMSYILAGIILPAQGLDCVRLQHPSWTPCVSGWGTSVCGINCNLGAINVQKCNSTGA